MELIDERENQKVVDENLPDYGSANQSKGIVYALCGRYQKKSIINLLYCQPTVLHLE